MSEKKKYTTARELGRLLTAMPAGTLVLIPAGSPHQANEYVAACGVELRKSFISYIHDAVEIRNVAVEDDNSSDLKKVAVLS